MGFMGIGLGLGLLVLGAAFGIGKLAAATVESMARQPEVAGKISTTAIVLAALIEGFTFYALLTAGSAITAAKDAEVNATHTVITAPNH